MIRAFLIPVLEGVPIDLSDVWDPGAVLALIEPEGLSVGGGPTYYVTWLLDHPDCTPEHLGALQKRRAWRIDRSRRGHRPAGDIGVIVFRSYGSSEHPSITGSMYTAPEDKRLYTDGNVRPGVEIGGPRRRDLQPGAGPVPRLHRCGLTEQGLRCRRLVSHRRRRRARRGRVPEDHRPQGGRDHSGRRNISALEVEEVLLACPGWRRPWSWPRPDARLGEHTAAVLRIRAGARHADARRGSPAFKRAGAASRSGPRKCIRSRTSRGPPVARCRSTSVRRGALRLGESMRIGFSSRCGGWTMVDCRPGRDSV